ncbi:MAG: DUF5686 and carboxypeptidase regulatory-like domain-containing protein [Bacteroidetes bacterium]|nr:DUF5686 and carboxypeptidase regulatory-like domain-containing protein [Bacteroidota bacterium]MBU1719529.1 DUF5686 and carboxypeptidase regulatory-like domain-containing protein [Bacteroidota bacterium]
MKTVSLIFSLLIISLLLLFPFSGEAQLTKVKGTVTDSITGEPLPFVNIAFKGKTIGTTTDFNGNFMIETKYAGDTLVASCMGYNMIEYPVKKNQFQTINYALMLANIELSEVVITPGENPAHQILRNIIANKKNNDKDRFDAYQYEVYNKIQFDINNIDEKFKNRRVFRPFKFVFDEVDTSVINGKPYLPVFLSEALSDFYFRKKPKSEKEIINATQISGVDNESVSQFVGNMYINVNIYSNYIEIFQKNFVSPISNQGLIFYKYYLVDSTFVGDKWCYKLMFKPRRKQELTFTGQFWVNDTTWAIKDIDMRIAEDANINFINDLVAHFEFDKVDSVNWMLTKEAVVIDFNPLKNENTGLFGHRTATYKNFVLNQPMNDEFYNTPTNITVVDSANKKPKEFWETHRHEDLSKNEVSIYEMIDTVKSLPAFRTWVDIVTMVVTGYWVKGNFEIGPYASMLSFNDLEGPRLRLGGRTSNAFSTKLMLDGYCAYGLKDEKFKYGGGFIYMVNKNPRESFGANYKRDIEQMGLSSNAFREDYILTSVFRRNPADKLSTVEQYDAFYEKEWFGGFSNTVVLKRRDIYPMGMPDFVLNQGGEAHHYKTLTTSEMTLKTRFAFQEKFFMGEFERVSLGTRWPIFQVDYTYGIPNCLESNFEYHKVTFNVKDWFNFNPFGYSKYVVEAGKIWGKLPYPLMKLHEGNETYYFDEYAFNLMNFYEFVSDQYVSFYYTHHFEGFFMNKIPLFRKLKWREFGLVKGVIGSMDKKNRDLMDFLPNMNEVSKPYFEAGIGIENVFRIFRFDMLWRLSHLDHENVAPVGFRGSMVLMF